MRSPDINASPEQEELDAVLRDIERKLPDFAKPIPRLIGHPPRAIVRMFVEAERRVRHARSRE